MIPLMQDHRRSFADNRYVYPVVSRRSKGVSIGINLNPDKICNFDCVYCQVDRTTPGDARPIDRDVLLAELDEMLDLVQSGSLFTYDRFRDVPLQLRRLNDIAFSGDGEPTTHPGFGEIVAAVGAMKDRREQADVKLVLITNATRFHKPEVQAALETLLSHNGEIWAKLESGTAEYYRTIERTTIPFERVLENIAFAATTSRIVIQSMFLQQNGIGPSDEELEAYCSRLNDVLRVGGRIKLVQVYTVARRPAEATVGALSDARLDAIAARVRERTGLAVEAFYGST